MVGGPGCSCGVSVLLELTEFFCGDVHPEVVLFGVGYGQQWVLGVGMVWVVCGPRFEPVEVVAGVDESVDEVEPYGPCPAVGASRPPDSD